jgi:hypothetical protein
MQAVEVGSVAPDVERHDLPLAPGDHLGGAGHPLQQKTAPGGLVAFAGDVLVRLDRDRLHRNGANCGGLRLREDQDAGQLGVERMVGGPETSPRSKGGSAVASLRRRRARAGPTMGKS